jgi:protoheme IX farnesyltransferase
VTHGLEYTCRHILLYTALLTMATVLPVWIGMSGWLYLAAALTLDAGFLGYALRLVRRYDDALSRKTFKYSIVYLTLLFTALIVDRLLRF